nr:AI-2E family transporter [Lachnospiraceae bacterium]
MKGFDKKYIRIGLLLVICACLCISFYFLMKNGAESLIAVKDHAVNTMLPFINGLVLAYLLNPIMKAIEERLMLPLFEKNEKLKNKKTLARGLSLLLTIIIFALILTGLIVMIVPQLFSSIQSIILRTPSYLASLNRLVSDMLKNNPDFEELFNTYSGRLETLINNEVLPALQSLISTVSSTLLSYVYGFVQSIIKFIVGIILCVYLLFRKEAYLAQCKKVVYAFMSSPERANQLINNARFTNRTFGGFITGKLFDSLIIGIITFI